MGHSRYPTLCTGAIYGSINLSQLRIKHPNNFALSSLHLLSALITAGTFLVACGKNLRRKVIGTTKNKVQQDQQVKQTDIFILNKQSVHQYLCFR